MRTNYRALFSALLIFSALFSYSQNSRKDVVVALCVQNYTDLKSSELLVKSLKRFGGELANSEIVISTNLSGDFVFKTFSGINVKVLPLEMDSQSAAFPYAFKAFASANAETYAKDKNCDLVWFDNQCLVLNEPNELRLEDSKKVAFRPVFLQNTVAQSVNDPVNNYWSEIYKLAGIDSSRVPGVETFIDSEKIRFYINCQVITVDPAMGIFNDWLKIQTRFINDSDFQANVCNTRLGKIFLHQAVLSAAILSKISDDEIQWLSNDYGFPVHIWDRIPDEKKIDVNKSRVIIYEEFFNSEPGWMDRLKIQEPLYSWISENYISSLKVCDGIYRLENSCNSYLITSKKRRVIVDPGGASSPQNWLSKIETEKPLKAVILTHGHEDHTAGTKLWAKDENIPVIANKNIVDFIEYQDMLAPFTAQRVAKQRGLPMPDSSAVYPKTDLGNLQLFCDSYTFICDDLSLEMTHVGGETPDNSTVWIPELKAFFIADNFYTSFPNLYTLRGTMTRQALQYIKALDIALSKKPEYLLMGHGEPIIGWKNIEKILTDYRNAIQYVHDETVKGINEGKDVFKLMKEIELPTEYENSVSEAYGRVSWSVRGIYEGYVGWFDGNVTNMYAAPPSLVYNDIIMLAGRENLLQKAKEYFDSKNYSETLILTDILLSENKSDKEVISLRMQTLVQLSRASKNWIEMNWLRSEYQSLNKLIK